MKKIFLLTILVACVFSGSLSVVFGEMMNFNVGVASGDNFRYSYTCYFHSSDLQAAVPAAFSAINQTDYFMINVTAVSGASVNFETMLRGLNGSTSVGSCRMNVGSGVASISGYGGPSSASSFYFMASNVGMMGRMFPSSNVSPTINDTVTMLYAGGSRQTNHFASTENNAAIGVNNHLDIYYDQATGMMVQWRQETLQTSGTAQTNSTQLMRMVSSNVWAIPEFPISTFAMVFMVGGCISVVVLGLAKFKRTPIQIKLKV
jgi:hypothetical protein